MISSVIVTVLAMMLGIWLVNLIMKIGRPTVRRTCKLPTKNPINIKITSLLGTNINVDVSEECFSQIQSILIGGSYMIKKRLINEKNRAKLTDSPDETEDAKNMCSDVSDSDSDSDLDLEFLKKQLSEI
jgi:hypothetical protein